MRELEKHFSSFNPYWPTLSLTRGPNRQTGMIIGNKLDNYFFVSADRQTFLGFEMMANLRDTSPLKALGFNIDTPILLIGFLILLMWYKWEESVLA